jgi:hypothetical protein
MLVLSLQVDEEATLYSKNGEEIGKIRIIDRVGGKIRVAFDMTDDIAIARPGISREVALAIYEKKKLNYGKK